MEIAQIVEQGSQARDTLVAFQPTSVIRVTIQEASLPLEQTSMQYC